MNLFDRLNTNIRNSEASLVNLLSAIAPWGAPLAPAYMSYWGMVNHLGFTVPIALILAGVVEILGLATVHTTITFWQYNRRRLAEYKKRPTLLAAGMFAVYLSIILTVNVLLEWPHEWLYTPILARALLSLLSVPAAVTLAIRAQHTEMLNDIRKSAHHATHKNALTHDASRTCAHCGEVLGSQQALAAHLRWKHVNGKVAKIERVN